MNKLCFILLLPLQLVAQQFTNTEISRWKQQAKNVSIIRDNFGIPHIYGKSDADAVFGLLYAQCEDDFKRVEANYIEKLGRTAEVSGEKEIYNDLFLRLVIDSADAITDYKKSPLWLKKLMNAFADGINFYLYKHPEVKPALLTRFQPWYPLLWTDGSIGAISTGGLTVKELREFYTGNESPVNYQPNSTEHRSSASNGFAIAPSKTANGNALLYINPHVTFYFRPEVHMVSNEGLNVYGAVTWGQFFIYQGFNEQCGWMHTSSEVDVSDLYEERFSPDKNGWFYEYENEYKQVTEKKLRIRYIKDGILQTKTFPVYSTHHGPVMAKRNGRHISVKANNRMMNGLMQSWLRTKANDLESYKNILELKGNTSNNTVFADSRGNIAYWHGNFVPVRNTGYNWAGAVDGTTSLTEWQGLHELKDIVQVINPATGWIQNCNSTPFTSSGSSSPQKKNYPDYMAPDGENFRGVNAVRVLNQEKRFTLDKLIQAGYDRRMAAFEIMVPALVGAFEKNVKSSDSLYSLLAEPIAILKKWDYNSGEESVATTLAVEWGQLLSAAVRTVYAEAGDPDQVNATKQFIANAKAYDLIIPFVKTIQTLQQKHGSWKQAWGQLNRYQRTSGALDLRFTDQQPSLPVGFASATWGMLPSFSSRYFEGTLKRYGTGGNSFVCAVEFGKKIKARSLLAGGNSSDSSSPYFENQAWRYTKGKFKDVLFYKEDVLKHMHRKYHPGSW